MTANDFRAWRARLGLSQRQAADALELSISTVKAYDQGHLSRRDDDGEFVPAPIPRVVALACEALELKAPKRRSR